MNFVRLYVPDIAVSHVFSARELYEPSLIPNTQQIVHKKLSAKYKGSVLDSKTNEYIVKLRSDLKKHVYISPEEELKIARLVVQATHPAVTMLLLAERTEVFVSEANSIGDTMDVVDWHKFGSNSGMQSSNGTVTAVFISCGGSPLRMTQEKDAQYGDGWPAIARLLVIGGQELGHYADIKRDERGHQIGRYSANFHGTRATERVRLGRISDIQSTTKLLAEFRAMGLASIVRIENEQKFYEKNNKGFAFTINNIKLWFKKRAFLRNTKAFHFVGKFRDEKRFAIMLEAMIEDTLFNLAPQADVYKSADKDEEEAIACIEALARVPQQVNKWGHATVKVLMANLYQVYYNDVILGCIAAYENISGEKYAFDKTPMKTSLLYKLRQLFKKQSLPTREV
jgi:hypothetical protein